MQCGQEVVRSPSHHRLDNINPSSSCRKHTVSHPTARNIPDSDWLTVGSLSLPHLANEGRDRDTKQAVQEHLQPKCKDSLGSPSREKPMSRPRLPGSTYWRLAIKRDDPREAHGLHHCCSKGRPPHMAWPERIGSN